MPNSLRDRAIEHAERGFCVFPVIPGEKRPAVKWRDWSTTDLETIHNRWSLRPGDRWSPHPGEADNYNIGIDCGKSGLLVLDIDMKKGKNGQRSLDKLTLENEELPETPISSTPSGGKHYIFRTTMKIKNDSTGKVLGEGIDIRAEGGYIVAPGSVTDVGRYEWSFNSVAIAEAPEWLLALCQPVETARNAFETVGTIDETFAVRRAITYLKDSAPPAIEGDGGDETTYKVACQVKDMGLSDAETYLLMLKHYNERCEPPWDPDEMATKVASAFKNAQNAVGAASPQADFAKVDVESVYIPTPKEDKNPMWSTCAGTVDLGGIPPRDWIIPGRLISEYVTLTVAPGGTGKSLFSVLELLAVATGKNLTGIEPVKSGPVLLYNLEDPSDEIYRRLIACCIANNLPVKESLQNVFVQSGLDRPLLLAGTQGSTPHRSRDCDRLEAHIEKLEAVVVCIDPLVRAHRLNENDNMAADYLMDALSGIAKRTKTAFSIIHHTAKNRANEVVAGNVDMARGASAFINAARTAHTLVPMDIKTRERFHIDDATGRSFLRLDEAKINLSAANPFSRWYRKRSVTLINGDNVGALVAADLDQFELENATREEQEKHEVATQLAAFVLNEKKTLNACAAFLTEMAPHVYSGKGRKAISKIISESLAGEGVLVEGRRIVLTYLEKGNTKYWVESKEIEE